MYRVSKMFIICERNRFIFNWTPGYITADLNIIVLDFEVGL